MKEFRLSPYVVKGIWLKWLDWQRFLAAAQTFTPDKP
jgi:hypothetical protein